MGPVLHDLFNQALMVNDGQDVMLLSQELVSMQFMHTPEPISHSECKSHTKTHQLVQYRNTNAKKIWAFFLFFFTRILCVCNECQGE